MNFTPEYLLLDAVFIALAALYFHFWGLDE